MLQCEDVRIDGEARVLILAQAVNKGNTCPACMNRYPRLQIHVKYIETHNKRRAVLDTGPGDERTIVDEDTVAWTAWNQNSLACPVHCRPESQVISHSSPELG